ncbi:MAG: branched-chain amino acid transport system II carrier protein [Clostridia bacterium]|nr:branched-chain amino acid transport system II carrier protein [Clostridia bacterium]
MKPEKKASLGDVLVIGFAMFAMFFGAGNLIFPPSLGMVGGEQWFTGFLAFVIADGGLAVLTVLAMIRKDGSIWSVIDRIGDLPAKILASVAILTVGPMLCVPRTCATTFEMGITPLFPGFNTWVFSIIFFGIVYMLTIRPSAVVDIIGKYLTPVLLIILAVLVVIGILNPIGEISSVTLVDSIAKEGILAGYQTMDVLVSLAVTLMLVGNAARNGYTTNKERMSIISKSSIVALLGLGLVYGGLTYLGATTSSLGLGVDMSQTGLVVMITEALLGRVGVVLLALIVFFACLTTAIGLVSASADFFSELSKGRVKYALLVALICIFAAVIANVGIGMIIALASPVLNIIYPVLLTQTVLSFFDSTIKNHNVNLSVAIGTFVMAIFGVLADMGAQAFDFVYSLPLAEFGFFWLVPAVVAGIIGAFIPMNQPKA